METWDLLAVKNCQPHKLYGLYVSMSLKQFKHEFRLSFALLFIRWQKPGIPEYFTVTRAQLGFSERDWLSNKYSGISAVGKKCLLGKIFNWIVSATKDLVSRRMPMDNSGQKVGKRILRLLSKKRKLPVNYLVGGRSFAWSLNYRNGITAWDNRKIPARYWIFKCLAKSF